MAYSVLKTTYEKYKLFVTENVELVGEIETGLKLMSYFVAGNKSQFSPVLSELMYSISNILVIIHDTIIIQALKSTQYFTLPGKYLRLTLNLIEYLEVFAEITSAKLWGDRAKWLVIAVIQSLKAILRLILLLCEKSGLLLSPPVLPMTTQQRKAAHQDLQHQKSASTSESIVKEDVEKPSTSVPRITFTLKRSGRTVRSLSSGTPALGRTWRPPDQSQDLKPRVHYGTNDLQSTPLHSRLKIAEVVHALRPLVHLISLGAFGTKSWIPWLFSCGLDVASLKVMKENHQWNEMEKTELRFRTAAILYYVLRSPFYDKFTKERAMAILMAISKRIPGTKFICSPLMDYLPVWQATYFYSWGS